MNADQGTMIWVLQGVLVAAIAVISFLFSRTVNTLDHDLASAKAQIEEGRRDRADLRLCLAKADPAPVLQGLREEVARLRDDVKDLEKLIRERGK